MVAASADGPVRPLPHPGGAGLIGPNAILQMLPVIEKAGGRQLRDHLLASAGIFDIPSGEGMIAEAPAARLHQVLRAELPDLAPALTWEAGRRTADYILAHRIPGPAQWLLRALPAPLAARLLARAITQHAWTFAGSGTFVAESPTRFTLARNPITAGESAAEPVCFWHAAVFERLFDRLVTRGAICRETACCACGDPACSFELLLERQKA